MGGPDQNLSLPIPRFPDPGRFAKESSKNEGAPPKIFGADGRAGLGWEQTPPQLKRLRAKAEEIERAMAEGRR
jgi:hypothetical protein